MSKPLENQLPLPNHHTEDLPTQYPSCILMEVNHINPVR